jgi:uncharacterized protein
MTSTVPIVALYAGLLGLLAAALTINVILNRVRSGVESGDGGVPSLMQALRAHGNFAEQAPIALILIASAEAAGARVLVVHIQRRTHRSGPTRGFDRGIAGGSGPALNTASSEVAAP